MATVIDSLLIELGLDASKFDKAQKKSVDELRKFDAANEKSSKAAQMGAKAMNEGFTKLRDTLISVGIAVVGINGVKDFLDQMVGGNAALGRTSALLGMSAKELHTWGAAAKTVGGSAEGFQASMQNIEGGLAKFRMGTGGEQVVTALARLGVQAKDGSVNLIELSAALVKMKDAQGIQSALAMGQQLGLDQGTFQLLLKGPAAVKALHDKYLDLDGVTDENIKAAQDLAEKWALVQHQAGATGQAIFHELIPSLEKALDLLNQYEGAANKKRGVTAIAGGDFLGGLGDLSLPDDVKAWALFLHGKSDQEIAAALDKDFKAPPRGIRNNNPGNIKSGEFAAKHGAIGSDSKGFAIFDDMAAGEAAMMALLKSYAKRGYDTIAAIIKRYAPAGENNTAAYIADVSKKTGIGAGKTLSAGQYRAVAGAMATHENGAAYSRMVGASAGAPQGGAGGTTVETNINTINVQTQATDADGIARDMHKSLQNNALINAGTGGAN